MGVEVLLAVALGTIASALGSLLESWKARRSAATVPDRQAKISQLMDSLRESSALLGQLETEIADSAERAEQLQAQITRDTELANMTEEQAKAVTQQMAALVGESDRRSFWQQFALNLVFFGLGIGATLLLAP